MKGFTDESCNTYNCSALLLLALVLLCVFFFLNVWPAFNHVPSAHTARVYDVPFPGHANPGERFVLEGAVDINSAGIEEFSFLPGIGKGLAKRIVEKREEMGGFGSVDELKGVKGIGETRMNALRPYVEVKRQDN
ncbi:MAG: helix-hairpin-helix domain-containing protein [Deltaproteobacteria bacterium]|nr:helix-hairpin-helix domain-containing protein [Deltaproteobacteria bacterium]